MLNRAFAAFWPLGGRRIVRALSKHEPRILAYHRLAFAAQERRIGLEVFERQLKFLRETCRVLDMEQLMRLLQDGTPPPPHSVVLTFDDGYADFFQFAYPLLQKYAIPAVLYVPTDFVDGRSWLWPDRLRFALYHATVAQLALSLGEHLVRVDLGSAQAREAAWHALADRLLLMSTADRESHLSAIARELKVELPVQPPQEYRALSWEQLRTLSDTGITIGSHTCSHPRLASESAAEQEREICASRARIEAMLQKPVQHFCYPNGDRSDFTELTVQLVRRAGYASAMTGYYSRQAFADPHALGRHGVDNSLEEFEKIIGGWRWLATRLAGAQPADHAAAVKPSGRAGR